GAVAQGGGQRVAEHDAGVLDQVVLVDVKVSAAPKAQVEMGVAGHLLHHVIEEAEAGRDLDLTPRVQPDLANELRLPAHPLDLSCPFSHSASPRSRVRGPSAPPC